MTGFGRADGSHADWRWHWELKTVNSRGLDVRMRLPQGFESIEQDLRSAVQARLKRGAVQVFINVDRERSGADIRINTEIATHLMSELDRLADDIGVDMPSLDTVLTLRGVVEAADVAETEEETEARLMAVEGSFIKALDGLIASRGEEGGKLATVLESVLLEIESLVKRAGEVAASAPENLRARLEEQVKELLADRADMPEERIIQEVALLAGKADVREEIDRLNAHISQARDLLANGDAVGRKLDFLAQEFNREANTLCSKSSDTELTRIGLDLKAAIEQLREQVQNVE
jgi:uncharacterized protein (TIGR00255 family)